MFEEHDFEKKLAFSRGVAENTHPDTIRKLLGESCVSVVEPSLELNKLGIGFVATLRGGATLNIDVKARLPGCSRFWQAMPLFGVQTPEPELALETWSSIPVGGKKEMIKPGVFWYYPHPSGKIGWTLDESKLTDFTLHVFHEDDCKEAFFLSFQLLRMAFRKTVDQWMKSFFVAEENSTKNGRQWKSQSVFVPGWCVQDAINAEERRTL